MLTYQDNKSYSIVTKNNIIKKQHENPYKI